MAAATIRARVDRLLADVGVDETGTLAGDVKALASSLGVAYDSVGATVSALEAETYGRAPDAPAPAGDGLEARSVKELKAEAQARGASLVGCVEKADMVAAIRAAPARVAAAPAEEAAPAEAAPGENDAPPAEEDAPPAKKRGRPRKQGGDPPAVVENMPPPAADDDDAPPAADAPPNKRKRGVPAKIAV